MARRLPWRRAQRCALPGRAYGCSPSGHTDHVGTTKVFGTLLGSGGVTTPSTWDPQTSQILDDGATQTMYGIGMVSHIIASGTYYYLAGGLDSVVAIVNGSGTVVYSAQYDVYGALVSHTGSTSDEQGFVGGADRPDRPPVSPRPLLRPEHRALPEPRSVGTRGHGSGST